MPRRAGAALTSAVLMAGTVVGGQVVAPPAEAVSPAAAAQVAAAGHHKPRDGGKRPGPGRRGPDRTAPATPSVGGIGVGPGGSVWLSVRSRPGTRLVVTALNGGLVAAGTATSGYTTFGWTASAGTHTYAVQAVDRAGNRSGRALATAYVDTTPPGLSGLGLSAGTPSDTRTWLTFRTEAGSAYRVLVDGRQVLTARAPLGPVTRWLDLPDGRHRVEVEVRDAVGNVRSRGRWFAVRIRGLNVGSRLGTGPARLTQVIRVRATPTATRGVMRFPGEEPTRFRLQRGAATVRLRLEDGTEGTAAIRVRDDRGRSGLSRLPIVVDTTPPTLAVVPDATAAASGELRAAVRAEGAAKVRWWLLDPSGAVASSGGLEPRTGGTITADAAAGRYRLVVTVTDTAGRAATVRTPVRLTDPPVAAPSAPGSVGTVLGGVAALLALCGVALLGHSRRRRRGPDADPPVTEVLHRTPVRLYEPAEEDDDGLLLASRSGELVIGTDAIAFVDDATDEGWSMRIAALEHVSDDATMVLPEGEQEWLGLQYADCDAARHALDLVTAHPASSTSSA